MAKAYFFNGGAFGHINPTLGLVAELVERGEEIIYYATEDFRDAVERTGVTYRSYPVPPPDEEITSHEHLATYQLRWGASRLPDLIKRARHDKPDYILFDSQRPWGLQLAELLNVPAISSSPSFAISMPILLLTQPRLFLSLFFGREGEDSVPDYTRHYRETAEAIRARHGLKSPWPPLRALSLYGDITLLFTIREMQPAAFTLNRTFKFIGPCIKSRNDAPAFPTERFQDNRVLFISLGTAFNQNLDFWKMCIDTFGNSQYTVLMAVGPGVDVRTFERVPDNLIIENYVRQLDVFPHTALHIGHGGMGSTQEALYHDVPLVLVPQMIEQEVVARQVARSGAGVRLQAATLTAERLRTSVERVLSTNSFKHNAERLGSAFRQTNPSTAADIVEGFLNEVGRPA